MFKIIIVDDEPWVIENIKASINWESHGFRIVGQADNGSEALEMIAKVEPDIVLTDIRMPLVDGLQLIEKSKTLFPDVKFIVFSGYADFEYAQKAMNYGALGYCLKPLIEEELLRVLKTVKSHLMREDSYITRIRKLLEEKNDTGLHEFFKDFGLLWNKNTEITVVIVLGMQNVMISQECPCITIKIGLQKQLLLFENRWKGQVFDFLNILISDNNCSAGSSSSNAMASMLQIAIEEAELAAYRFFTTNEKKVFAYTGSQNSDIGNIIMKLEKSMKKKDIQEVEEIFNTLADAFGEGTLNIKDAVILHNSVIYQVIKLKLDNNTKGILDNDIKGIFDFEQLTRLFGDIQALLDYLKKLVIVNTITQFVISEESVENKIMKEILQYVNSNFWKDISSRSISHQFYLNPSYFCQLFKKELGKTFLEYLSEIRIQYACELLRHTNLSVNTVREKCGYYDCLYFNRIFKRLAGRSPSQYRDEFC